MAKLKFLAPFYCRLIDIDFIYNINCVLSPIRYSYGSDKHYNTTLLTVANQKYACTYFKKLIFVLLEDWTNFCCFD